MEKGRQWYLVSRLPYHESDDSEHAVDLLRRMALAEGVHVLPEKPVLHGDNGATLKATTVLAMMNGLGIRASHSRPRVSDDNAFVESLFRTAKYRQEFPVKGLDSLDQARQWASNFVRWYNHDHLHSGIRYVSPAQRHAGEDQAILEARHGVYQEARARKGRRSPATAEFDQAVEQRVGELLLEQRQALAAREQTLARVRPSCRT